MHRLAVNAHEVSDHEQQEEHRCRAQSEDEDLSKRLSRVIRQGTLREAKGKPPGNRAGAKYLMDKHAAECMDTSMTELFNMLVGLAVPAQRRVSEIVKARLTVLQPPGRSKPDDVRFPRLV